MFAVADVFSVPVFQPVFIDVFAPNLPPIPVDPGSPLLYGLMTEEGFALISEDGFSLNFE